MSTKNSRSHEVASVLRTEILRNQYRVGERLPSERDLSSRFDANRGAVREALKQLEQLGIITIQPGGARVLPKEEATLEILGHLLSLDDYPNAVLVDQFLLVFKVFCVMSAEASMAQANEEQLAFMEEKLAEMKGNIDDREVMKEAWSALFEHFLTINDNLVMRLVANGLRNQLMGRMASLDLNSEMNVQKLKTVINRLHRAVKSRSPEKVGEAVAQYFQLIRQTTAIALADMNLTQNSMSKTG